jgi:glycerol uptake facilitator protein
MHGIFLGEFLGTMTLTLFGCGVVANMVLKRSKGEGGGWLSISTGWGFAVVFGVFVAQAAGSVQADINPAVTIGKYLLHIYTSPTEIGKIMLCQLIGAFLGAAIVWLAYLPHWTATFNQRRKLSVFCTLPEIRNYPSNLICEIIGTFALVIGIGALTSNANIAPGFAPYLVGVLVWGIGLSLGGPTGFAINPARDLGPRLAHAILPVNNKGRSDWAYAWVPVVGPIIGAALGAIFWMFIFV